MPQRNYQIDVIVDDHGAVQKLKDVATAEDQVTSSAQKSGDVIDIFGKRKAALAEQASKLSTLLRDETSALSDQARGWDTVQISQAEADRVLSDLHVTMQSVPGTLTQIRGGLNEVATGAGFTVEGLGLLTSGFLAVGVAVESWKLGRWIADLTGADEKIAHLTATMLGWGDVAAESTAAKQDVLAQASANVGYQVTDLTTAIEINTRAHNEWQDAIARGKAHQALAADLAKVQHEINVLDSAGVLPQLTTDINSHNFSVKELADRYRATPEAIQLFIRNLKESDAAIEESDRRWKAMADQADRIVADVEAKRTKLEQETVDLANKLYDIRQAREKEMTMVQTQETNARIIASKQEDIQLKNQIDEYNADAIAASEAAKSSEDLAGGLGRIPPAAQSATGFMDGFRGSIDLTSTSMAEVNAQLAYMYAQMAGNNIGTPHPGAISPGFVQPPAGSGFAGMQTRDGGGSVSAGRPYMIGRGAQPELFIPKTDGMMYPAGSYPGGGGGATVVYLSVDARGANFTNERDFDFLADRVSRKLAQSGVRLIRQ